MIWKKHDEDQGVVDLDTVPDKKAIRVAGAGREALALSSLVEKIMASDEKTTVVYHDDGSKKQGAGSFSVQGATISKKFYPFPTLSLSAETRENLSQLKLTILAILSAVSGVSSEELWRRIDFTMTDSTIHNMKVDEMVSSALGTDHTPAHLLCQVHPAFRSFSSRSMLRLDLTRSSACLQSPSLMFRIQFCNSGWIAQPDL